MKIVTDHYGNLYGKATAEVDANEVVFRADDNRAMFCVRIGKDGRSIEIRGVDTYVAGGQLYSEALSVEPSSSNVVVIRSRPLNYEE